MHDARAVRPQGAFALKEPTPEQREAARALLAKEEAGKKEQAMMLNLIDASTIEPEEVQWLWPGWLARRKLHILAGAPGTGKTTIAMSFAACVSAGRPFPSGECATPGTVLIWSGEDDFRDTLVPRLIAAGANRANVKFVGDLKGPDGQEHSFDPAQDVPILAARAALEENVALIVIDPIVMAIVGDSHKNAEVRRGLDPLVKLASKLNVALIGISHFSKGTQGRAPLERVTGSLGFGALARMVYGTVRLEQEDEGRPQMMFARMKSNIGFDGGGYPYQIETLTLPDSTITATRIAWGEAVSGAAHELLAEEDAPSVSGNGPKDFLRTLLAEGPMPARDVRREASEAGYSWDAMHRAKRKLGVVTNKSSMKSGWVWGLPGPEGSEGSERSEPEEPLPSLPSRKRAPLF